MALDAIHRYIRRAAGRQASHAGLIFVDMFHNNIVYLLRALLIAAYLRAITGRRLVGLVGKPGVVVPSCGDYDVSQHSELAHAFLLDDMWLYEAPHDSALRAAQDYFDTLNAHLIDLKSPTDARRAIRDSIDPTLSMPVGRFIYETTLRAELCGTVWQIDEKVMKWGEDIFSLVEWFSANVSSCRAITAERPYFVTGHVDYSPWAVIADVIRKAEGEVFYFTNETAFAVYRLSAPWPRDEPLSAAIANLEGNWFSRAVWSRREQLLPEAIHSQATEWRYRAFQTWTARNQPDSPLGIATSVARAIKAAVRWEADKYVNIVFCQAMADQPISSTSLYVDRSDWATATIEFAAAHPERNWVIKSHPRDGLYDVSGTFDRMRSRFSHLGHLVFVCDDMPLDCLIALGDVGVTQTGSPGIAFAASGKPVITAGVGRYTNCGFTLQPQTVEEYRKMLLIDPKLLRGPEMSQEKALLYKLLTKYYAVHFSHLLPNDMTAQLTESDWRSMALRFNFSTQCDDDLFAGLQDLCLGQGERLEPRRLGWCQNQLFDTSNDGKASLPAFELNQTYSMHAVAERAVVFTGFHGVEPWGVWTRDDTAVACMFINCSTHRRIAMHIHFTRPYTQGNTSIAVGGEIGWTGRADRPVVVLADVDHCAETDQSFVLFAIYHRSRDSPIASGSTDARRLGVGLKAIGLYGVDEEDLQAEDGDIHIDIKGS